MIFWSPRLKDLYLISGFTLGLVSRQRVMRYGMSSALSKVLRRAATLYLVTIGLTFSFAFLSRITGASWVPEYDTAGPGFIVGVLTLHRTYAMADVALLYTFLLLLAIPALMLMAKGRTCVLLLVSWGLWALDQLFPNDVAFPWPVKDNHTFDLVSWQVIFMTAMVAGYHRQILAQWVRPLPKLPYFVGATCLMAGLILFAQKGPPWILAHTSFSVGPLFAKSHLAGGRLLAAAIVLQFAFLLVTCFWVPVRWLTGWLLLPMGQNALYAYAVHPFLLLLFEHNSRLPDSIPGNTLVEFALVLVVWLMIKKRILFSVIPR